LVGRAFALSARRREARGTAVSAGYVERIETLDDVRGSAWNRTEMVRVWVRRAIEAAWARALDAAASARGT